MKQIDTYIKENTEYKDYTCYFADDISTGSPKDLFLSAFVEEYIFKLYYERRSGVKVIKTNEENKSVKDNWNHIDIKTNHSNIDIKTISRKWNSISVNTSMLNSKVNIGTIIEDNDKIYIVVNDIKKIKDKGKDKGKFRVFTIPILLEDPLYKTELYSDLSEKYKKLIKLYNIIPDYNNEGLKEYSKIVLDKLTPIFQQEFGLTPKIEFV